MSCHLPLHRGGSASPGVGRTESSPLLLTEGGPEGAGCGGDPVRSSPTAPKDERPHIRHGLRPMTPSPQGEGFGRCFVSAPTAPHPAALRPPSPRGRHFSEGSGHFYDVRPYTPSEPRKRGPPPPTQGRQRLEGFGVWNSVGYCLTMQKSPPESFGRLRQGFSLTNCNNYSAA